MNADELIKSLARLAKEEERKGHPTPGASDPHATGIPFPTENEDHDQAQDEGSGTGDPRWEALAEGRLDNVERAGLEAEAQDSAAGRAHLSAYEPLGQAFENRMAGLIQEQLAEGAKDPPSRPSERLDHAPTSSTPGPTPEERGGQRQWWIPAAAAALAACMLLVLWPRGLTSAPLPTYTAQVSGGQSAMRDLATAEAPRRFGSDSKVEILLRPEVELEGKLDARAYRLTSAGAEILDLPAEISEQGAVRLTAKINAILPPTVKEGTLLLAIGRPGTLPGPEEVAAAGLQDGLMVGEGWVLKATPIVVVEDPP